MKKKILFILSCIALNSFANDNYVKVQENKVVNNIEKNQSVTDIDEEDDFVRLRRKKYANEDVKTFKYFSRWHKYLEEVAQEEAKKLKYEEELAKYNEEVAKITKENERIRAYNEGLIDSVEEVQTPTTTTKTKTSTTHTNVPSNNSVDVSTLNQENLEDSKKD